MYKKDVAAVSDGEEGHEEITSDYRIVTNNERLFSLRVDTVIAMGGSDSFTKIYNIDKKTGKMITLKDLFHEGSDYKKRISDSIKEQMRAQMKRTAVRHIFWMMINRNGILSRLRMMRIFISATMES